MNGEQVELFVELAGGVPAASIASSSEKLRILGAGLILSETLEYIIKGLGLTITVGSQKISDPQSFSFDFAGPPVAEDMLDGLADIAYTLYWNAIMFQLPIEAGFKAVCENNLQKFVSLSEGEFSAGEVVKEHWHLNRDVHWPDEVVSVVVVATRHGLFAVGKDANGKVRKPSTYTPLSLTPLLTEKFDSGQRS